MRKLHLLLPLTLLALAFGLVACGDDGESDEARIIEVIETSATSDDPADCEALATQAFLEQTQLAEGAEAVSSCEEEAREEENDTKSVEVSKVEVEGSTASADVAFAGGSFDGQALSVALVEEDGDWKLDEVVEFAEFDQERFVATLEEALSSGEDALEPPVVTCMGEAFGALSKAETERVLFGDWSDRIVEFFEGCS